MPGDFPALEVSFAPGVASSDVPTGGDWVDISDRVTDYRSMVGRQDEESQPGAGSCELELDNADGALDPDNTSGLYYPDLLPLVWFRVRGGDSSVDTDTFYGQVSVEGFRVSASQFSGRMVVSVTVLDMLEQAANTQLPASVWDLEVEAPSPTRWYKQDEGQGTVATDSAAGANGEYEGGATFGSSSALIANSPGSAITYAEAGERLYVTEFGDWKGTPTAGWAIFGWFEPPSDPPATGVGDFYVALEITSRVGGGFLALYIDDASLLTVLWVDDTSSTQALLTESLSLGSTHSFAVRWDDVAELTSLWVDGVKVDESAYFGALPPAFTAHQLSIGDEHRLTNNNETHFTGTIDDVVFFDEPLDDATIASLHAAGSAPWAGERTDERAAHLLDAVGFPAGLRTLATGSSTVQAASLGGDLFSALTEVAAAERGVLYVDHHDGGKLRLESRSERWTATRSITSQATFGDGAGEVTYTAVQLADGRIVNTATVQRSGGANITVEDAASITQYQRRSYSETGLIIESDAEAASRAAVAVAERKDRRRIVRSVTLEPADDSHPAWAHVFARQLGDRVTVKWRPPYGGTYEFPALIEGISHSWRPADDRPWSTTFYLSPVPYGATAEPYFIIGTSLIGGPARIAF